MSFITGFNFDEFSGDMRMRGTVHEKVAVSLSLLSAEDMERQGFVEIKTRVGKEIRGAPWKPLMRKGVMYPTFWDTRMGNFDFRGYPVQSCSSCAAQSGGTAAGAAGLDTGSGGGGARFGNRRCPGHLGIISMPRIHPLDPSLAAERMYVYNPHLRQELETLLQAECFFCHRFRASQFDVERYRYALILCDAGLVGEGLHLLDSVAPSRTQERSLKKATIRQVPVAMSNGENGAVSAAPTMTESVSDIAGLHRWVSNTLIKYGRDPTAIMSAAQQQTRKNGSSALAETASSSSPSETLSRDASTYDIRNDIVKRALKDLSQGLVGVGAHCPHCDAISPRITSKDSIYFFHFGQKAYISHNVDTAKVLSPDDVKMWEAENALHGRRRTYFSSERARKHIKALCTNEASLLSLLFPSLGAPTFSGVDRSITASESNHSAMEGGLATKKIFRVFFLDRLPVPPLPLRLQSGVESDGSHISPDDKTRALSDILGFVEQIEAFHVLKAQQETQIAMAAENGDDGSASSITKEQIRANEGNIRNLQLKVNETFSGVLESFSKKEGLFRMHMMGKRVNQACRSVISPDFTVEPNEVLLPRPFARNLSFPEQATFHSPARTAFLKKCAINGPKIYPGATHIEVRKSTGEVITIDLETNEETRKKNAAKYFALAQNGDTTVIVYRHVITGDRLVFNRQPTLHKPSMQGYRARVLSGLKTIRFHYVNAKSYNADFDGDEMNIHVPQTLECRAELETLMDANLNYIAPTSGKPIRGLIQDHVASAVYLTLKDTFFSPDAFIQLVYTGLQPYLGSIASGTSDLAALIPVPAVLLPNPKFTGKQVFSTILKFVSGVHRGARGLSVRGTSSIQPSIYGAKAANALKSSYGKEGDHNLLVEGSVLLRGVLCKNQIGPSGNSIPHVLYEICGPHAVGIFFGAIGRVLTAYLQKEGFSMGMEDMILTQQDERLRQLDELDQVASVELKDPNDEAAAMGLIMDRATKLQQEFVPSKLLMPFPVNQLVAMTQSGAKGSNTNAIQMALVLGQQLFDGRRVKRMNSGKTLPGFFTGDVRARSFGYAMGCFASGIRPPEYTIHAMAGRDGLIDTAVKTSRSGHLQRCLIKGLESLVVHWDSSVRDCNGSVVQFVYGGDGLDPMKSAMLNAHEITRTNLRDIGIKYRSECILEEVAREVQAERDAATPGSKRPQNDDDTLPSQLTTAGNPFLKAIADQAAQNPIPEHYKDSISRYLMNAAAQGDIRGIESLKKLYKMEQKGMDITAKMSEKQREWVDYLQFALEEITNRRRLRSAAEHGEPVGLLAAQAAGEPSTQMTLNTFHSAGSTVTHVTEGIPRLRELLIYASVQNGAVLVPVEKATAKDFELIHEIMAAAVPCRLTDALAPIPAQSRMRYSVRRAPSGAMMDVDLVMSSRMLKSLQTRMCMSDSEHIESFVAALRKFAKTVVHHLRGRSNRGDGDEGANGHPAGGASSIRRPVQDPADLDGGAHNAEEEQDTDAFGYAGNKDDNDGDDSDDDAAAPLGANHKSRARKPTDNESNSENDVSDVEDDAVSTQNKSGLKQRTKRPRDLTDSDSDSDDKQKQPVSDDDDEDVAPIAKTLGAAATAIARSQATAAKTRAMSHAAFHPFSTTFASGKFRVSVAPMKIADWLSDIGTDPSDASAETSLFVVRLSFDMPGSVINVLPDVLAKALEKVFFPTLLPQCGSAKWQPSTTDASSGELVFEGHGATVSNVVTLISSFSPDVGAHNPKHPIKIHRIMSTDINDMCESFGIEVGYATLFSELCKLFKRYAVDSRHLSLIADAATHRGVWENYNFTGIIARSSSPLFQMTFASSKKFLHTAVTRGVPDSLESISSAILVGEKPRVGTALVSIGHSDQAVNTMLEQAFAAPVSTTE